MVDLRKDKRAPASLKVKYKSATVDQFIEQFGTDVSRGGIFIKTKKPIETGALLKLELQLNDASPVIHGIGRVCFRREVAQEPNLPAGMGIKFIKLDPGSRAIVERIVNARGEKPSRFDQTEGAEVAPASLPPDADEFADLRLSGAPAGDAMSLAPAPHSAKPPAAAAPSIPVAARTRPTIDPVRPASEPARATPTPARAPMRPTPSGLPSPQAAPRAGSGSRPFPRSGSGANTHPGAANPSSGLLRPAIEAPRTGSSSKPERFPGLEPSKPAARGAVVPPPKRAGVAGLFANSPIAQSAPVEPPATNNGRSSFFPPAPDEVPASVQPQRGRARDLGSQRPPFTPRGPAEAARAEQARHSGEFLATAFEQGGVTRATTEQARVNAAAAQATGEDSLIDELFAGVVEPPPTSAPAARNGAPQNNVDDMFAELSQEEGLAGARRASSQGAIQAPALQSVPATARVPAARKSQPGRVTEDDSVDALFAELDRPSHPPPSGMPTPLPKAPPPSGAPPSFTSQHARGNAESVPPFADSVPPSAKSDAAWSDAPSNEEADLDAGEAAPLFSEPPRLADSDAQQQSAPHGEAKRPASVALFIGLAVLVLAAGGGYVYYSRVVQPTAAVAAVPLPKIATPSENSAAEAAQPTGANAPSGPAAAAAEIEIEVTAVPRGADVSVNGKRRGLAPTRVTLVAGKAARVIVSNSGFASMTKTVTPEAGQEPLRFELEPLPYSLMVRTSPAGAELTAGASSATAPGPLDLGHLDGGVLVSVGKPGFQRMTRPVRLDEFTEQDGVMRAEIEVRLTELPRSAGDSVRARIRRRPDEPPAPEAPPAPSAEAAPDAPEPVAPAAAAPAAPEPPPGLPELPPEVAKPAEAAP